MLYLITQELPEQCIVLSVFGKRQAKSREGALLLIERTLERVEGHLLGQWRSPRLPAVGAYDCSGPGPPRPASGCGGAS